MVNFKFSKRLCLRQTNRPPSTLRALDKPTSVLLNKNKPKTCKVQNARERYLISLTSECIDSRTLVFNPKIHKLGRWLS